MDPNSKGMLATLEAARDKSRKTRFDPVNPVIQWDPPEIVALRRELQHHPGLVMQLGSNEDDLPTIIGILAAAVDIAMDGVYTQSDILRVAELITDRLYTRRVGLVLTGRR